MRNPADPQRQQQPQQMNPQRQTESSGGEKYTCIKRCSLAKKKDTHKKKPSKTASNPYVVEQTRKYNLDAFIYKEKSREYSVYHSVVKSDETSIFTIFHNENLLLRT